MSFWLWRCGCFFRNYSFRSTFAVPSDSYHRKKSYQAVAECGNQDMTLFFISARSIWRLLRLTYILFRLNVQASCVFHRNCRALTNDRNWNVFHSKNQKPLQPHSERLWIVVLAMQEVRLCPPEKFQMHREPPTFSWQNSFSTRSTSLRAKLSAKEDDLRAQEYAFVKLKSILTIKWKNVWTEHIHKSLCIQFFSSSSFVCLFVSLGKWLGWL